MEDQPTLEQLAATLEASGDYKILRRLVPRPISAEAHPADRIAAIIDLETTGLDYSKDEVIELGMVRFTYSAADEITALTGTFHAFNEPTAPIPIEITGLTGITNDMVRGEHIDATAVEAFVQQANVIIAHNAAFDRKFAERFWPIFAQKNWACSVAELEWRRHGFAGANLSYLLTGHGLFHEAHRAVDDCHALLEVLARPLPHSTSTTALAELLARARKSSFRIWAHNSPFDLKDVLKVRGYRWWDGSDGSPRCWYVDVDVHQHQAELNFLKTEIYQRDVDIRSRELTALERFSLRV